MNETTPYPGLSILIAEMTDPAVTINTEEDGVVLSVRSREHNLFVIRLKLSPVFLGEMLKWIASVRPGPSVSVHQQIDQVLTMLSVKS
jgi:hypothetical protein